MASFRDGCVSFVRVVEPIRFLSLSMTCAGVYLLTEAASKDVESPVAGNKLAKQQHIISPHQHTF